MNQKKKRHSREKLYFQKLTLKMVQDHQKCHDSVKLYGGYYHAMFEGSHLTIVRESANIQVRFC